MAASDDNETTFDPKRRLCPDGSCIGVIEPDGKCGVCGARAPAGEAAGPAISDGDPEVFDVDDASPDHDATEPSGFDANRRLCSDDSCIGVIGSDSRCSMCGKPADG